MDVDEAGREVAPGEVDVRRARGSPGAQRRDHVGGVTPAFLIEHPDIAQAIEQQIRDKLLIKAKPDEEGEEAELQEA